MRWSGFRGAGRAVAAVATSLLLAGAAQALPLQLEDGSSLVTVDPDEPQTVANWVLDGTSHLRQQRYWIDVGGGTRLGLDELGSEAPRLFDTDGDGGDDTLFVRFLDPADRFEIELRWSLQGSPFAGPGAGASADLATQLSLTNTSGSALDLTLFQYTDVDLFGSASDDEALFSGSPANTLRITDSSGLGLYESVVSRAPDAVEAALFGTLLPELEGGAEALLSGALSASGDVVAAMAWQAALPAGGSFIFSQDQTLTSVPVPEPAAGLLLGLGLAGAAAGARRRRG